MSELKKLRTLTVAGMLTAVGIMTGFFKITFTDILEVRFMFLSLAAVGALFGPVVAAVSGAIIDVGSFLIRPTGTFFPGFTLSSALSGVIFGLCLHDKKGISSGLFRVVAAVMLNTVIVNLLLNSLWLSMLYGKGGLIAVMSARLIKEAILIPINIILVIAVLKPMEIIQKRSAS